MESITPNSDIHLDLIQTSEEYNLKQSYETSFIDPIDDNPLESPLSNTTHDCKYCMPEKVSTALNSPNGLSLFFVLTVKVLMHILLN